MLLQEILVLLLLKLLNFLVDFKLSLGRWSLQIAEWALKRIEQKSSCNQAPPDPPGNDEQLFRTSTPE